MARHPLAIAAAERQVDAVAELEVGVRRVAPAGVADRPDALAAGDPGRQPR
jgi:hypothetical protein